MSSRKVEMVLELIDRASRPARRILALQERLGRAADRANRLGARAADAAARASGAYGRATEALARAQGRLRQGIARTNQVITQQTARLRRNAALMRDGAMGVGRAAVVAGGMFAAYGASALAAAKGIIEPAAQFERFEIQLATLEGSAEAGQRAMAWVEDFATRTPMQLDQVTASFTQMRSFGLDPTDGSMMKLMDTMNALGGSSEILDTLVLALGKSWTTGKLQGEQIIMMMERGVPVYDLLAEKMGKTSAEIAEMATAGKLGRDEIQLLIDAMGTKYYGATEKIMGSWDGITSNIGDWWTKFRRMVADSGVFEHLKEKLRGFLDTLDEMNQSGELQRIADMVGSYILSGIKAIERFARWAFASWRKLYPVIEAAANALGGWRNLALAVLAIPLRGVLFEAALGFAKIALGAGGAASALARISFAGLAGGAMRAGSAMLGLLNPVKLVRAAFIALRVALISTGIGALVVGLAMAGTWIYNNWSGLTTFFQSFGQAFSAALGPAKPLADKVVAAVRRIWFWVTKLVGPLDASAAQWAAWGAATGEAVAGVINFVAGLPGRVRAKLEEKWAAVSEWTASMWANLTEVAATAWDGLKSLLLNYTPQGLVYQHWDQISAWFVSVWNGLAENARIAWDALKGVLDEYSPQVLIIGAWDTVAGYFVGVWEDIKSAFSEAWAWIDANVMAPMRNAVAFMTDNAVTRGVKAGWSYVFGSGETATPGPVQEQATGGSFSPGWLLTGEQGPELEYRSRGGYIAHNAALMRMVAMSERLAANLDRVPLGVADSADGLRYLRAGRSDGPISVSAPVSITIEGKVGDDELARLERILDERDKALIERIAELKRQKDRRAV